jgi:hypothetical protein
VRRRKRKPNIATRLFAKPPEAVRQEETISAAFGTRPCSFHYLDETIDTGDLDQDRDAIVKQQARVSYAVHLGVFTSFRKAYTLCTQSFAPRVFDVVVRTRPDSFFNVDKLLPGIRHVVASREHIAVAGCNRRRSLAGGDFSEVAFVATREFWELYVSTFDPDGIFDALYARPCMAYQKGQPKTRRTKKMPGCCDVPECKQVYTELGRECEPDGPPPCSFTPETFFKWWMNDHKILDAVVAANGTSENSAGLFGLESGALYIARKSAGMPSIDVCADEYVEIPYRERVGKWRVEKWPE